MSRSFALSYRVGSAVIVREHPARWGLTSGSVVVLQSVAISGAAFLGLRGGGKKRRVEDSDKFAGIRDKFSTPPPISEYSVGIYYPKRIPPKGVVPPTPPPRKKPAALICRPKPKRMPIKRPAASPVLRPKSKAKARAPEVVDITGGDPDPLSEELNLPLRITRPQSLPRTWWRWSLIRWMNPHSSSQWVARFHPSAEMRPFRRTLPRVYLISNWHCFNLSNSSHHWPFMDPFLLRERSFSSLGSWPSLQPKGTLR